MWQKFLVWFKRRDARRWEGVAYVYGLKQANQLAAKLRRTGEVTVVQECWQENDDDLAECMAMLRASKQKADEARSALTA